MAANYHLAAYFNALSTLGANVQVNAVTDNVLSIRNNSFFPGQNLSLLFAYAGCGELSRARLVTPTFRRIVNPQIRPISLSDQPPADPNIADYRGNPLAVPGGQELEAQHTATGILGPVVVLIGLRANVAPSPAGSIYTIRGVGATALTAAAWSNAGIVWDDTLPPGRYGIVGLMGFSATGLALRLILQGDNWRPGCLANTAVADRGAAMFRKGGMGSWGDFSNDIMPQVEALATAADAAVEVYMDIVKLN